MHCKSQNKFIFWPMKCINTQMLDTPKSLCNTQLFLRFLSSIFTAKSSVSQRGWTDALYTWGLQGLRRKRKSFCCADCWLTIYEISSKAARPKQFGHWKTIAGREIPGQTCVLQKSQECSEHPVECNYSAPRQKSTISIKWKGFFCRK